MNTTKSQNEQWQGLCIHFVLFPAPLQNPVKIVMHTYIPFLDCSVTVRKAAIFLNDINVLE